MKSPDYYSYRRKVDKKLINRFKRLITKIKNVCRIGN